MERVKNILNDHIKILENYPPMPKMGVGGVDAVMSRIFHESDNNALHQKVVGAGVPVPAPYEGQAHPEYFNTVKAYVEKPVVQNFQPMMPPSPPEPRLAPDVPDFLRVIPPVAAPVKNEAMDISVVPPAIQLPKPAKVLPVNHADKPTYVGSLRETLAAKNKKEQKISVHQRYNYVPSDQPFDPNMVKSFYPEFTTNQLQALGTIAKDEGNSLSPYFPGMNSGVTIGFGYDAGQHDAHENRVVGQESGLPEDVMNALDQSSAYFTGTKKKKDIHKIVGDRALALLQNNPAVSNVRISNEQAHHLLGAAAKQYMTPFVPIEQIHPLPYSIYDAALDYSYWQGPGAARTNLGNYLKNQDYQGMRDYLHQKALEENKKHEEYIFTNPTKKHSVHENYRNRYYNQMKKIDDYLKRR